MGEGGCILFFFFPFDGGRKVSKKSRKVCRVAASSGDNVDEYETWKTVHKKKEQMAKRPECSWLVLSQTSQLV